MRAADAITDPPERITSLERIASFGVVLLAAVLEFRTADRTGALWWYDSPSHALNGAFLYDLLRQGGFADPVRYALGYFARYPALTLGFYPPGFACLLVPFYALFGVSAASAQLAVSMSGLALGLGVRALGIVSGWRLWPATAAGLLSMTVPEMLVWGRQVQPELPAYAFAVWGFVCLVRWCREERPWLIHAAAILTALSLYTRLTMIFVLPVLLAVVLATRGRRALSRRDLWLAGAIGSVFILPLAAMTLAFGGFNWAQAIEAPGPSSPFYYLAILPDQLGLWTGLAALVGLAILVRRPEAVPGATRVLLPVWLAAGLLFFSLIALRSPRFTTAIVPAACLLATLPFMLPRPRRLGDAAVMVAALAASWLAFATTPERLYTGPEAAVQAIAAAAPPHSAVLLLAHRSGALIFDLRTLGLRPDLRVIRAEKLYTRYRVSADWGVADLGADQDRIRADMARQNVALVAVERGFWTDLPSIRQLDDALRAPPFVVLQSIPLVDSTRPDEVGYLDLYRRTDYVPVRPPDLAIDLPLVGWHVTLPADPP